MLVETGLANPETAATAASHCSQPFSSLNSAAPAAMTARESPALGTGGLLDALQNSTMVGVVTGTRKG
jgi:hypothetical protein